MFTNITRTTISKSITAITICFENSQNQWAYSGYRLAALLNNNVVFVVIDLQKPLILI